MPRGDKSKYTDKQERKASHIAEGYKKRGVPKEEAERRAWAIILQTTAISLVLCLPAAAQTNSQTRENTSPSRQMPGPQRGKAAGTAVNRNQTREVQQALGRQGYYFGRADGILGPETKRALLKFQETQRLPPSGQIMEKR